MELDLGAGGVQIDRVLVLHTGGRLNGVTLYVMDNNQKTIMSQFFSGITETPKIWNSKLKKQNLLTTLRTAKHKWLKSFGCHVLVRHHLLFVARPMAMATI